MIFECGMLQHFNCIKLLLAVYGALIGKQYGRTVEVMNSFELLYTEIEGDVVIDREYYYTKEEQC